MPKAGLLQDLRVLCTSLREKEKLYLQGVAVEEGAVVVSSVTANDPPHVVITRRVGSPKYFLALRRNPRTPVVTPEWLTTSLHEGKRVPYENHVAGPFYGLTICFSGLPLNQKNQLAQEITQLGGTHSSSLSRECTHLITTSTDSDKYIFAQRNQIPCLTPAWLIDSVQAGWCQEERKYSITPCPTALLQRENSIMPGDQGTQSGMGEATTSLKDGSGATDSRGADGPGRSVDAGGPLKRTVSRFGRDVTLPPTHPSNPSHPTPGGDGGQVKPTADIAAAASAAAAGPVTAPPVWDDLDCDDDAPLFLDWCHIWMVGCSLDENFEVLKLCRIAGAKRLLDPHPTMITHVVVGGQLSPSEAQDVYQYCLGRQQVGIVGVEWLRRSVARQVAQPLDERFAIPMKDIKHIMSQSRPRTAPMQKRDTNGALEPADPPTRKQSLLTTEEDQMRSLDLHRQNSASLAGASGGFLENCYFTLAAIKGTAEETAAERLVRAHGGRLFNASLPGSVASGSAKAFALCPPSLTPSRASALRSCNPDFAGVPETGRFTLYWLECCVQAKQVLAPNRGTPCFQPLQYTLPLAGTEKISVSISGYDIVVRNAIKHTVETIGGRVSMDFMSAKDTHLILSAARGEKFKHAARFGVIPVTADWLVDSVVHGRLQPEQYYRPRAPPGAPAIDEGGGSGGGFGSNPSILGITQMGLTAQAQPAAALLPAAPAPGGSRALPVAAVPVPPAAGGGKKPAAAGKKVSIRETMQRLTNAQKERTSMDPPASKKAGPKPAAKPITTDAPPTSFNFDTMFGKDTGGISGAAGGSKASAPCPIASIVGSAAAAAPAPAPLPMATTAPLNINGVETSGGKGRKSSSRKAASRGKDGTMSGFGGSETQGADDLAAALNNFSSLLDRFKGADLPPGQGSQHHEMPPPPPRHGNSADGESQPARGRKNGKRAWSAAESESSGPPLRRSTRQALGGSNSEMDGFELSQQVGYESMPAPIVSSPRNQETAEQNAAKERLERAVTRQKRGLRGGKNTGT